MILIEHGTYISQQKSPLLDRIVYCRQNLIKSTQIIALWEDMKANIYDQLLLNGNSHLHIFEDSRIALTGELEQLKQNVRVNEFS